MIVPLDLQRHQSCAILYFKRSAGHRTPAQGALWLWVHRVLPPQEYVWRMTNRQTDRFLTLSPRLKAARKFLLCGEISLLLILTMASLALAQAGPTLQSATFFGGAGDQRGTGIAIGGGAVYVSGNVQPKRQGARDLAPALGFRDVNTTRPFTVW